MPNKSKYDRILSIYTKLILGDMIRKTEVLAQFGIDARTFQRDKDDIRAFLCNDALHDGVMKKLIYDRKQNGYRLDTPAPNLFSSSEALAVCIILINSSAFDEEEMRSIIERFLQRCALEEAVQKFVWKELRKAEIQNFNT